MIMKARITSLVCMAVLLASVGRVSLARAQSRANDHDVESMMRNLRDDAKSFQPMFNDALKKSVIRNTSREKEAKSLASNFVKQTDGMLNTFKKSKKADMTLPPVISTASEIQKVIDEAQLNPKVVARWEKVKAELQQVASAFGINDPLAEEQNGPLGPGAESAGVSCREAAGQNHSQRLVAECLQVSPATHPPCNAENSCSLIINEIKRGCAMIDPGSRPAFCGKYS